MQCGYNEDDDNLFELHCEQYEIHHIESRLLKIVALPDNLPYK